jgi:hypothetical protein
VIPSAELQGFITTLVKGASNEAEALQRIVVSAVVKLTPVPFEI